MKKIALIFLASFLISPFAFAYESCVTPKTEKIDIYGTVLENTWREFQGWSNNERKINTNTQIIIKLETALCAIVKSKKDNSEPVYSTQFALIPSAGVNLSEMIGKSVEVKGEIVLTKVNQKRYPLSIVVESIKVMQ